MARPELVEQAKSYAVAFGFGNSCLDEVGEFLHVLAGHINGGKIADIGTGCGVSAAWMASATTSDVFTVDNDTNKVDGLGRVFRDVPHVHTLFGEWESILDGCPFRLVFVDAKPAKLYGVDLIVDATEVGGLIVLDDLTPLEFWPDEWKGKGDPVRDAWLNHRRLASVEIRTSAKASAILARRTV